MPPDIPIGDEDDAARTARHVRALRELTEIGLGLARSLQAEAVEPADPAGAKKPGLSRAAAVFAQIQRGAYRIIALEARLVQEYRLRAAAGAREAQASACQSRATQKIRIRQIMECAMNAHPEGARGGKLRSRLEERLYPDVLESELAVRSVAAIVTRICQTLGVPVPKQEFHPAECQNSMV